MNKPKYQIGDRDRDYSEIKSIIGQQPKFWFGDISLVVFEGLRGGTVITKAVIYGMRFCHAVSEWIYSFELGQTARSGIVWFYEWELEFFENNYRENNSSTNETKDDKDRGDEDPEWDEIPF